MRHVHAAAVILINAKHKILIAQRRAEQIYPDYWEFPGGKVEAGEAPEQAAIREAKEEIGVDIEYLKHFTQINETRHPQNSDSYRITVDIWVSFRWNGEPKGAEGQNIAWIDQNELDDYKLLPANIPLIPKIKEYINRLDRKPN